MPCSTSASRQENTYFSTWDQIKHDIVLHCGPRRNGRRGSGPADRPYHLLHLGRRHTPRPYRTILRRRAWAATTRSTGLHAPALRAGRPCGTLGRGPRAGGEPPLERNHFYAAVGRTFADDEASWLDLAGSGYAVSAAYPEGEGLVLRLYNAAGDDAPRTIRFGTRFSRVEAVDLRGEPLESPAVRTPRQRHRGRALDTALRRENPATDPIKRTHA